MTKTKELPKVKASDGFTAKVTAKAKLRKIKKHRTILLRRISSGVAVAAVLALCVVSFDAFEPQKNVADNSPVLTAKNHEDAKVSTAAEHENAVVPTPEPRVAPNPSEVISDENTEEHVPSFFSEVDLEYYTIATVELTEENTQTVEALMEDYEKDDTGYIVPDINILLRKLNEAGIQVKTEVSPDITNDYIVIK